MIKFLEPSDKEKLKEFLLSLSKETIFYWNRFGDIENEKKAAEIAEKQVSLGRKEEAGFVFEENKKIIGYSYLRFFSEKPQKKYTASLGIVVTDRHRGKGIGIKLMQRMIAYAKEKGFKKIWLATYTDNKNAIGMYKKLGFEVEGIFMYDEFFGDAPKHVISMALFLDEKLKNSSEERNRLVNGF